MRARALTAALPSNQGHVCLSCRLHNLRVKRGQRYQHGGPSEQKAADPKLTGLSEELEPGLSNATGPESRVENLIQLLRDNGLRELSSTRTGPETPVAAQLGAAKSKAEAKQKTLQERFAAKRREQMLKVEESKDLKATKDLKAAIGIKAVKSKGAKAINGSHPVSSAAKTRRAKTELTKPEKSTEPATRPKREKRAKSSGKKITAVKEAKTTKAPRKKLEKHEPEAMPGHEVSGTLPSDDSVKLATDIASASVTDAVIDGELNVTESEDKSSAPVEKIKKKRALARSKTKGESLQREPQAVERKEITKKDVLEKVQRTEDQPEAASQKAQSSENERKAELTRRLTGRVRRIGSPICARKIRTGRLLRKIRGGKALKQPAIRRTLSGPSERTLKTLDQKAGSEPAIVEKADATKLELIPVEVDQPPVPGLAYGLERVLFNPGIYQLQDPRSRVFNFDPYLQKIMPVAEFDFNALKDYITSSKDEALKKIAKEQKKRYVGSTSSMSAALSHFHFLLSQWRPINTSMLSKNFPAVLSSFTELQRVPAAIFLRWKDGTYAIDADKTHDHANVLTMLGKSMEKLLTLDTGDYERYRKSNPGEVSEEERSLPESFHYSTMGDFLMRSQLDAHDPRLPGTGMFDLKTRAVVSIRMDVTNYEQGVGYQIKSRQGEWESFEREYYDLIRAAFLKYSMQVRMGRMDGIFVAFHNVERIFGFQYISLPEMDSTIHGQWDTCLGDQEFKLSLDLLNKILNKATAKFPKTSIRLHFETRDAATPFMYVFAEPVTEEQVVEIQGRNDAKIREFESRILGLNREKKSDDRDEQEEDSKWDNIQASVQEAMDEDELSVDEPGQYQEPLPEESETTGFANDQPVELEEGLLHSSRDHFVVDERFDAASIGVDVNDLAHQNDAGSVDRAEKEESPKPKSQTEADLPFLDSMDQEPTEVGDRLPTSDILAMTLTLRNKVNGKFVHRPDQLGSTDQWSIEYTLVEVPTQEKSKALYQACKQRRKKRLAAAKVSADTEVVNHYLANLRKLSSQGKQWRKKMDERDGKQPVQVLGSEESIPSDQEAEG